MKRNNYQTREQRIYRGDIYMADISYDITGHEQSGIRPVLVISNDIGNLHSPTITVAMISSKRAAHKLPTHLVLPKGKGGLERPSLVLCEQIRTINKSRLKKKLGFLDGFMMRLVNNRIQISLGITKTFDKGDKIC